ncbi:MAG: hypothetical protein ACOY94_10335 [Bacillota bacterium]
MAEKKAPEIQAVQAINGWQEGVHDPRVGENRRENAASTVTPSGWFALNVEATEMFDSVAKTRGINTNSYYLKYFTNKEQGKAGFAPTTTTGPGIVAIRRYERKGSSRIVFYHSGPFKEVPDLRPPTRVKANVAVETLPFDGLPFITIAVKKGLEVKARSRKNKKKSAAATAAATTNAPAAGAPTAETKLQAAE